MFVIDTSFLYYKGVAREKARGEVGSKGPRIGSFGLKMESFLLPFGILVHCKAQCFGKIRGEVGL